MGRIKPDIKLLKELKEDGKLNDQMYAYALMMGPKKLHRSKLGDSEQGWREGYTKPTIEQRKAERRKKNKAARKARQKQRKY